MNNLNSVLLEGHLSDAPEYTDTGGTFTLISNRYYKNSDENVEKESCYIDVIMDKNLAKNIKPLLSIETHVRVVGRLSETNGQIVIIADHMEIKGWKNQY